MEAEIMRGEDADRLARLFARMDSEDANNVHRGLIFDDLRFLRRQVEQRDAALRERDDEIARLRVGKEFALRTYRQTNDGYAKELVAVRDALARLRSQTPSASDPLERAWWLASKNDGLFIINERPRPSNDDQFHERDGPPVVLNIVELPNSKAQAIVDAHNAALRAKEGEIVNLITERNGWGDRCQKAEAELAAAIADARREAIEECASVIEKMAIALRDDGPKSSDGILTAAAGANVGALFDASRVLRALAKKSP